MRVIIFYIVTVSFCLFLLIKPQPSQAASCTIVSNGTLAFGNLDPSTNIPVTVNSNPNLTINCKGNATITISYSTGLNGVYNLSDGAGHLIPYAYSVSPPGPGPYNPPNNTNYAFTSTGTISNYEDAWTNNSVSGTTYTDTITFTITY